MNLAKVTLSRNDNLEAAGGQPAVSTAPRRGTRAAPFPVCVQRHPRGRWEVVMADGRGRIPCETLDDARRIAYLSVAHAQRCELIVRDAYNRIIEHQLIEGD